jgi:hypothetical protein
LPVAAARSVAVCWLLFAVARPCAAVDPRDPEVKDVIDRAVAYLRENVDDVKPYEAGIVAYALMRGGESADSNAVKVLLKRVRDEKFKGSSYGKGTPHQFYEAGCDMMMFETAGPTRYRPELEGIASFIVENQWPTGSWYYYGQPEHGGDTSVSQYAVLGLWAAAHAGVTIPSGVWSRSAEWHLKNQVGDGGFAYHPGDLKSSTHSMTANGVASLCMARMMLYPNTKFPNAFADVNEDDDAGGEQNAKPRADKSKAGDKSDDNPAAPSVLESIDLSGNRGGGRLRHRKITAGGAGKLVPLGRLNRAISLGANWIRHGYGKHSNRLYLYYLYGLERMCALAGINDFDGHDWYSDNASLLIRRQQHDGHFIDSFESGDRVSTAFAILFLSRATAKMLGRGEEARFGGGLMIGGRGLPKNLAAVQATGDGVKIRKVDAPVDKLLSELENPKGVEIESVQQSIVESVEVGDREKLVGQKDRLKRLTRDPRAEVRRTALWALGRCATVHDASTLVKALDDPDINVVIEANNALCWLSRRPNGFGHPADPVAELPETATEEQRRAAIQTWRTKVRKDWRQWYGKVGPYSERELPIDLPGTAP